MNNILHGNILVGKLSGMAEPGWLMSLSQIQLDRSRLPSYFLELCYTFP